MRKLVVNITLADLVSIRETLNSYSKTRSAKVIKAIDDFLAMPCTHVRRAGRVRPGILEGPKFRRVGIGTEGE